MDPMDLITSAFKNKSLIDFAKAREGLKKIMENPKCHYEIEVEETDGSTGCIAPSPISAAMKFIWDNSIVGTSWDRNILIEYAMNAFARRDLERLGIEIVEECNLPRTKKEKEGEFKHIHDCDSRFKVDLIVKKGWQKFILQRKMSFQEFGTVTFDVEMVTEPYPKYLLHHTLNTQTMEPTSATLIDWSVAHIRMGEIYGDGQFYAAISEKPRHWEYDDVHLKWNRETGKPFMFVKRHNLEYVFGDAVTILY